MYLLYLQLTMTLQDPTPDNIFGVTEVRDSAKRLLNNYSNPWDPVAETAQNAIDAINTEYRNRLASRLDVPLESEEDDVIDLLTAIESATDAVVDMDARSFAEISNDMEFQEFERDGLPEDASWGDDEYQAWIKSQYYKSLSNALEMDTDAVITADEAVQDEYQGKITIKREVNTRGIVVKDNGTGMSPDELGEALKRYGSLKQQGERKSSQIGELGNGLTYVLANCSDFSIETCDGDTITEAKIEGMLNWVQGEIELEDVGAETNILEENTEKDTYTIVRSRGTREGESEFPDLFDEKVTQDRMIHLLRNKTAIGQMFDVVHYPSYSTLRHENVDVEYVESDSTGGHDPTEVEFRFQGPAQVAEQAGEDPNTSVPTQLGLEDAKERVNDSSSDIGEKSVVTRGVWLSSGGVKHYYQAFVASRDRYREICREFGFCDDPTGAVQDNTFDLEPRIEIAVKGMPCGIRIDTPVSGSAGYWGNFYIIIMNNDLAFDEGREKPATGRRGKNFKDCASDVLFREIGRDVISGTTKGSGITVVDDEDIIEDRTSDRIPLQHQCLEPINFKHQPTSEQDVVVIFHEALAEGILPNVYTGIDTSTWHTYDEIYEYSVDLDNEANLIGSRVARGLRESGQDELEEEIIVEFKKEGSDIFNDLSSNKKIYSEIDLLVCWTFDQANDLGITLSAKQPDEVWYWGTTHEFEIDSHLLYDASNQVDVIVLTELFERIDNNNYNIY